MKKLNRNKIIIISVTAIIVLILGIVLIKGCSNNSNNDNKKEIEKVGASENDIIKAYNMSKEDAINIVKGIYNSDVYEFSAEINEDSKYIVSVKNLATNKITKYLVDPVKKGSFYEIDEK